jgi:hypothetical protein
VQRLHADLDEDVAVFGNRGVDDVPALVKSVRYHTHTMEPGPHTVLQLLGSWCVPGNTELGLIKRVHDQLQGGLNMESALSKESGQLSPVVVHAPVSILAQQVLRVLPGPPHSALTGVHQLQYRFVFYTRVALAETVAPSVCQQMAEVFPPRAPECGETRSLHLTVFSISPIQKPCLVPRPWRQVFQLCWWFVKPS